MTRARNSANLASQGNLFVDITNDRTGIGSVVPGQSLHVAGTAGFHADVTFTGDLYNTTWDRSDNSLKFVDNAKAKFGTGGDLEIFHDGSHSRINDAGTGALIVSTSKFQINNAAGNEVQAFFLQNGTSALYFDNSKKFETTAYGTNTTGTAVNDGMVVAGITTSNNDITVPTSMDSTDTGGVAIQRFWSASISAGNIYKCGYWTDGEGAVQLLITVRSITSSNSGTSTYIFQGGFRTLDGSGLNDGDYHRRLMPLAVGSGHGDGPDDGDDSNAWEVLINQRTGYQYDVVIHVPSGRTNKNLQVTVTELNRGHNFVDLSSSAAYSSITVNSTPLLPTGRSFLGTTYLRDNVKLNLGNDNDLQLYHNTSSSYIDNNKNHLYLRSNVDGDDGGNIYLQAKSGENGIIVSDDGAVELYHDNSVKLTTTSSGATVTGELRVTDHLVMNAVDNKRIYLGAGNDLQIYHSGFNYIESHNDIEVHINAYTGGAVENMAKFKPNGAVELYHNNSKKFETTSSGSTLSGDLLLDSANAEINLKSGVGSNTGAINWTFNTTGTNYAHLSLPYDTRASLGFNLHSAYPITFTGGNSNETLAKFILNGAVELYHDNTKRFETTSSGIDVTGRVTTDELSVIKASGNLSANFEAQNGLGTLEIGGSTGAFIDLKTPFSDDFDLRVDASGTLTSKAGMQLNVNGSESGVNVISNGAVELYHNGNRQVFTIDGGMNWQDNKNAEFGNSGDLKIYHSGSNSFIKQTGTGDLYLQCDSGETIFLRPKANEDGIKVINDGAVELYYDNSKKLETETTGVKITSAHGNVQLGPHNSSFCHILTDRPAFYLNTTTLINGDLRPYTTDSKDLGSTSARWRNIYTQDLQLSNEARKDKGGNDVDGTWGDWTLQEGEEEIFMINNRTGKKYAMMLKEVA